MRISGLEFIVCVNVCVCEAVVELGSRLLCVGQNVGPCVRPLWNWGTDSCVSARQWGRVSGRCWRIEALCEDLRIGWRIEPLCEDLQVVSDGVCACVCF